MDPTHLSRMFEDLFRSVARAAAAWWLAPLGVQGILSSGELVFPGPQADRFGWALSVARAQSIPELPRPQLRGAMPLEEALRRRRSLREFSADSLSLLDVSRLLWAGQGLTDADGGRTAPSAGALYPLDLFLVAGNVSGLEPGVYRYQPATHELTRVGGRDRRAALCSAALDQEFVRSAPAAIVITATYGRTTGKYGERGVRYADMEAGCAAENISLVATALGLGTVMVGAFDDRRVGEALGLPARAEPLCILPVGRPRN